MFLKKWQLGLVREEFLGINRLKNKLGLFKFWGLRCRKEVENIGQCMYEESF